MENFVIILIVSVIIGLAAFYIYKSKKAGKKCVGCPYSCSCSKSAKENCCSSQPKDK